MKRLDRQSMTIAAPLAFLAGFVDALGFIDLGGYFVSFMSGNSTRLGIGLGQLNLDVAASAGSIIVVFVAGVVGGSLIAQRAGDRRRVLVLGVVAALLALSALLHWAGHLRLGTAAMILAMGAENTVLRRDGASVGLTYMTGNLVRLGHALADAVLKRERWTWAPYFLLWGALVAGASFGAVVHQFMEMNGLWLAAAMAAGLSLFSLRQPKTDAD